MPPSITSASAAAAGLIATYFRATFGEYVKKPLCPFPVIAMENFPSLSILMLFVVQVATSSLLKEFPTKLYDTSPFEPVDVLKKSAAPPLASK
ncbi:hypothetical protein D3C80_1928970 [compost metagenome]